jgi:hypothetical protein
VVVVVAAAASFSGWPAHLGQTGLDRIQVPSTSPGVSSIGIRSLKAALQTSVALRSLHSTTRALGSADFVVERRTSRIRARSSSRRSGPSRSQRTATGCAAAREASSSENSNTPGRGRSDLAGTAGPASPIRSAQSRKSRRGRSCPGSAD